MPFVQDGLREYWLRAPTPSALLRTRPGSETIVCPRRRAGRSRQRGETLILGSGLCLEFELLALAHDPGRRLAAMGWRVIEPISPYHGLRAMPGFYGGEPFFALAPTGSLDLIAGQALETALLDGVGARPLRRQRGGRPASRCRRSSRSRSPAIAAFGRSRRGPMPCC